MWQWGRCSLSCPSTFWKRSSCTWSCRGCHLARKILSSLLGLIKRTNPGGRSGQPATRLEDDVVITLPLGVQGQRRCQRGRRIEFINLGRKGEAAQVRPGPGHSRPDPTTTLYAVSVPAWSCTAAASVDCRKWHNEEADAHCHDVDLCLVPIPKTQTAPALVTPEPPRTLRSLADPSIGSALAVSADRRQTTAREVLQNPAREGSGHLNFLHPHKRCA